MPLLDKIRMAFSILLALAIGIQVAGLILLDSAKATILDENFYLNGLSKYGVYSLAKSQAVAYASQMDSGGSIPQEKQLELAQKVVDAVPDSWLESQARGILSPVFKYLKSESPTLYLEIDFSQIREPASQAATDILLEYLSSNPSSAPDLDFSQIPGAPSGCTSLTECAKYCRKPENLQVCNSFLNSSGILSSEEIPEEAREIFSGGKGFSGIDSAIFEKIPEKLPLNQYLEGEPMQILFQMRSAISTANSAMLAFLALLALELSVLGLLQLDFWKAMRAGGAAVCLGAMVALLCSALLYFLVPPLALDTINSLDAIPKEALSNPLAQAGISMILDIPRSIAARSAIISILALALGGLCILLFFFLSPKPLIISEGNQANDGKEGLRSPD